MTRRLPPLNALRAFEAAARHLSFTLAAEELNVTQAAISHQVKALETHLGTKLFRRLTRRLILTDRGAALLPELTAGFDRLAQATARLSLGTNQGPLTVTLLTTFALGWLVPRLSAFQERHPEIDVHLFTNVRVIDFSAEDIDCGIRHGTGDWPGLFKVKLFEDLFTPLGAPDLAAKIKEPADLAKETLLQTIGQPNEWDIWLSKIGLTPADFPKRGTTFDSTHIAGQAAVRGAGLCVGDPRFFVSEIESGRLVQPLDLLVPTGKSYWFVCLPAMAERAKIKIFRNWLIEEAARFINRP